MTRTKKFTPVPAASGASRFFWTFLYLASFTLISHLLWFWFVPAWVPLRRFFSGLPLVFLLMIPSFAPRPCARLWLLLLYPLLVVPAFICAEHVWMFHTPISSQSFYVIFETGIRESREFVTAQIGAGAIFIAILTLTPPLWLLRRALRAIQPFVWSNALLALCLAALALGLRSHYGEERVFRTNMAYDFYASWRDYADGKKRLEAFVARSRDIRFPGVKSTLPGDPPRTVVVVIGESANRHHHALYGYGRPTNPELSAIKDELLLFDDIISSHSQTIPTVREAMSFPGAEGTRLPLVNLFRQAGFETIWLSNQISFENFYTEIAVLVSTADRRIELNRGGDQSYIRNFDGIVLPELARLLETPSPTSKRAIFIHLMGSHLNYASRYPKEFDVFTSTDDLPAAEWRPEKSGRYINAYDNSIRYTDHVLAAMIALLRQHAPNSALVYFSDHGEEVYDTLPQRGHVNALQSPYYFDIPFIIWLSPGYRRLLGERATRWETYLQRPAINSMFPWAAADLAGIGLDDSRQNVSVLSDRFVPQPRRILHGDYDDAFPNRPGARPKAHPAPAGPGGQGPAATAPS